MKANIILFSTAAFFLAGCYPENGPSNPSEKEEEQIPPVTLELSSTLETKTVLGEMEGGVYRVYWSEGDRVCVNGEKSSALLGLDGPAANGSFTVSGVKPPYHVFYPSIRCGEMAEDGMASISIPPVQAYKKNSFASGSAMLYGSSERESFSLNNLCGVVRIPIVKGLDGDILSSLSLSSTSAEAPIAGSALLDTGNGRLSWTEGETSLLLSLPPEGIALDASEPEYFHLCLPSGSYPEGFDILLSGPGGSMLCQWVSETEIPAGVVVTLDPIVFKPKSTKLIDSIESWNEFAAAVNAGDYHRWVDEDSGEARIVADISYGGDLTAITTLPDGFVLNGNGHKISRAQATEPLIVLVSEGATVKNLTVGGTRIAPSSVADRGTGNLAAFNRGLIDNCVSEMTVDISGHNDALIIGGLVTDNAGVIRDSKNTGDISISLSISANRIVYGGGICARGFRPLSDVQHCGDFIRCENKGSITLYRTASGNFSMTKFAIGGIVGCVDHGIPGGEYCRIEDCTNSGNIICWQDANHTNTNYGYAVGGILGRCCLYSSGPDFYYTVGGVAAAYEGYYVEISGCANTGNIDVSLYSQTLKATDSGARQVYVGGIAGCLNSSWNARASIINCTSNCTIRTGHAAADDATGGIVGGVGHTNIESCKADVSIGQSKTTLTAAKYMGASGGIAGFVFRDSDIKDCEATLVYDKGTTTGVRGTGYVGLVAKSSNIQAAYAVNAGYATLALVGTNQFSGTINGEPVTVNNVADDENVGKITGTITIK